MNFKRFSLIELLVVFTILLALGSLIQPSLKSMTSKAHILECKNKLKHLYYILDHYTQDHLRYPPAYRLNSNGDPKKNDYHITWDDLLGQGYDGRNLSIKEMDYWDAPFYYDSYVCPHQFNHGTPIRGHMRSYAFNGAHQGSDLGGISKGKMESASISEIPAPGQTILLTEILGILGNRWNAPEILHPSIQINHSLANPSYYHDHSFNYLFSDGHLELLLTQETYDTDSKSWGSPGKYWTRDPYD